MEDEAELRWRKYERSNRWVIPSGISDAIERLALDFLPSQADFEERKEVCRGLQALAKAALPGCFALVIYGSTRMRVFSPDDSDLDLSMTLKCPEDSRIANLRALKQYLERLGCIVGNIEAVIGSSVPIIKFRHLRTQVDCDVSVDNDAGVFKSKFLALFMKIDRRYPKLCVLLKRWARAKHLVNPTAGRLNSLTLILLATLHLQTQRPPILPPISAVTEGLDHEDFRADTRRVNYMFYGPGKFWGYGKFNKETLPELFRSFFLKMMAMKCLWKEGLCASTYLGRSILEQGHEGEIAVEDFIYTDKNVAKSLTKTGFKDMYSKIAETVPQFRGDASSFYYSMFGLE